MASHDETSSSDSPPVLATQLKALHEAAGARMVPFAGYLMPVQYPTGILTEHRWTREHAGLFDVSHMGQARLVGPDHATTAAALETLVAADVVNLKPGQQRYSQLLTEAGGIIDDLMFHRPAGADGVVGLVVNASRKAGDYAHIAARLPAGVALEIEDDQALVALQGPEAEAVMLALGLDVAAMPFMALATGTIADIPVAVSRSGYTGEDGFEISVAGADAEALWTTLVADSRVKPIGLGARDSLRLEGGLCLYGHELDETVSIVEAGLVWSVQKRRRTEGGFPGFARFARELADGPARVRVGLRPDGRAPAREGTEIRAKSGETVGIVTSGGFGPTVDAPVAMGFVPPAFAGPGTELDLVVRGKALPARVAPLPFVPSRFKRI
jgi:aminomethyltransferase